MNNNKIEQVCQLKRMGMPHRTIGKCVGISASTVHSILAKHHYPKIKREPRVLMMDIETSPILGYVWGLFNQNLPIDRIVNDWIVLTWAAKWLGQGAVYCDTVANYNYKGGSDKNAEKQVIQGIWDLLDEADIVVAHNGARFDKRKLNVKFLEHGLGEPSPYKLIDTLKVTKANFAFTSQKLDYIAKFLTGKGKLEHEGFPLWSKFLNNDEGAQKRMLDYNIQDVHVLEEVFIFIRGWDAKAPNFALYYDDNEQRCNKCGSKDLHELEGKAAYTNLSKFQLCRCGKCGGYSRKRVNLLEKEKRQQIVMNVG